MKVFSIEPKYIAADEISYVLAMRPSNELSICALILDDIVCSVISVSTNPGAIQFTKMPGEYSFAMATVRLLTAAFDDA